MTGVKTKEDLVDVTPHEVRAAYAEGAYAGDTWGLASGFLQTAVVSVPRDAALDFFTFCQRNVLSCPVLEVLEAGEAKVRYLADADIRNSLGRYRIFRDGQCVEERDEVTSWWRQDLVTFLIGCTGSFEPYLMSRGIDLPDARQGLVTPVYKTDRDAVAAGVFRGPLAVSMRQIDPALISRVVQITSRFPAFHGPPVHVGDPTGLGITDLELPYAGDVPSLRDDWLPVFWACSVTPQLAAVDSRVPFLISNAPGFMFLGDLRTEDMSVLA